MDLTFPILKGLQEKYDAIQLKDGEKIYITTDSKHIYIGDILLTEKSNVANIQYDDESYKLKIKYTDGSIETIDLLNISSIAARDFIENPIDLSKEVTGVLPIEKVNAASKFDTIEANSLFRDVSYNSDTGVLTFIKYDNTTVSLNLPLETIINSGYYDTDEQSIILVLSNGQNIKIPATALVDDYDGIDTLTIQVDVSDDNKISASLIGGSITKTYLSSELQSLLDNISPNRDFIENPINLENEVTGVLPINKVDTPSLTVGILDAPSDDKIYSRQNGNWVEIQFPHQLNWRGAFQQSSVYNTNDIVVTDDGLKYIALEDNLVSSPPSLGWELFLRDGINGKSAYEIAVEHGFSGTESEWLESLKGTDGHVGIDGKSAYEIAIENGFEGTETEWLESLKGTGGDNQGEPGADGKSAYEIAVENGFIGDEVAWLASLKGADGADAQGIDGKSAYEIALGNGFEGTEIEWLESLKGQDGIQGIQGEQGNSGVQAYPFSDLVWKLSSDVTGYNYAADIPVPDVTPDSLTQIIFDVQHAVAVDRAVIMGASKELDGAVRIYAMRLPEAELTGRCIVFGGV